VTLERVKTRERENQKRAKDKIAGECGELLKRTKIEKDFLPLILFSSVDAF
jgi:hypothetical protein